MASVPLPGAAAPGDAYRALVAGRNAPWPEERLGTPLGARRKPAPSTERSALTSSVSLFGAIRPARGTGAALMMPIANTHAMPAHLHEISQAVAAGAHAALSMDRAGWHITAALKMPNTITAILPPSRGPELNPVENVWQYLRQNHLSNRVFHDHDAIIEAGCHAWNRLIERTWRIMSIGMRQWARSGQC